MASSMNEELLQVIFRALKPKTLAYLVRDLEEAQDDWEYYPEEAPAPPLRAALDQTIKTLVGLGTAAAEVEQADFQRILAQARAELEQEEWLSQRDAQERQNWTADLE